jgi:hypothetical protein
VAFSRGFIACGRTVPEKIVKGRLQNCRVENGATGFNCSEEVSTLTGRSTTLQISGTTLFQKQGMK